MRLSTFDKLYENALLMNENRFRNSPKVIHKLDVPMFSIFLSSDEQDIKNHKLWEEVKKAFERARSYIRGIGFPSMHLNVLFKKPEEGEQGEALGEPHAPKFKKTTKYITLSMNFLVDLQLGNRKGIDQLVKTIVHEWGHIWMYNRGEAFFTAVRRFYKELTNNDRRLMDKDAHGLRKKLAEILDFPRSYGLKNYYEMWAVMVERFTELNPRYRKKIFELMQVNEPRWEPNKRMKKFQKSLTDQ